MIKRFLRGIFLLGLICQNQKNEVYYNEKETGYFARPIEGKDKTESFLGGKCVVIGNIYENPELLTSKEVKV